MGRFNCRNYSISNFVISSMTRLQSTTRLRNDLNTAWYASAPSVWVWDIVNMLKLSSNACSWMIKNKYSLTLRLWLVANSFQDLEWNRSGRLIGRTSYRSMHEPPVTRYLCLKEGHLGIVQALHLPRGSYSRLGLHL